MNQRHNCLAIPSVYIGFVYSPSPTHLHLHRGLVVCYAITHLERGGGRDACNMPHIKCRHKKLPRVHSGSPRLLLLLMARNCNCNFYCNGRDCRLAGWQDGRMAGLWVGGAKHLGQFITFPSFFFLERGAGRLVLQEKSNNTFLTGHFNGDFCEIETAGLKLLKDLYFYLKY